MARNRNREIPGTQRARGVCRPHESKRLLHRSTLRCKASACWAWFASQNVVKEENRLGTGHRCMQFLRELRLPRVRSSAACSGPCVVMRRGAPTLDVHLSERQPRLQSQLKRIPRAPRGVSCFCFCRLLPRMGCAESETRLSFVTLREKLTGKRVVLTRESGKNEQLEKRLRELGIEARLVRR